MSGPLPHARLSPSQEGLWFLNQLEPDSSAYHNVLLIRLEGRLDSAVLERAVNRIVERHEALRTRVTVRDGVPTQVADPRLHLPLPVTEVAAPAGAEPFDEAMRQAEAETRRPFDLAAGPAVRARLLRAAADDHLLVVTVHHVVCDGVGITIFMRELVTLYSAYAAGRPDPLGDPPPSYIEAVRRRGEQLGGERLANGVAYWQRQLAGAPPLLELPLDRPRPAVQSDRGATHRVELPRELVGELRALSRREGVTLYMTVLAALQLLLHRWSGERDVLVGSSMTGRTSRALRDMIAYLANTIVLRTRFDQPMTVRELLARVRETAVGAFRHSHVPFERVVQALRPPRARGHHPVFQVLLSYHVRGGGGLRADRFTIPGLTVSFPQPDLRTARFDLTLCVHESGDSLGIDFEYSADLFDLATVQRLAGHFQVLLEGMCRAPDARVDRLPLLTGAERDLLTREWSRTATIAPAETRLHQLFEAQAARTPTAVALVSGWQTMTYGELDRHANQLAHRLRALGAGPGELVGICVGRSFDMVASLLGVLKSGAGYVFVDPATPPERAAFILRDSRARLVVAETATLEALPDGAGVLLDRDRETLAAEPAGKPPETASGEDLAYCIYTSGSTGTPKAVGIRHAGCVSFLHWAATVFEPEDLAGVLASSSPMFDCALFELFIPLSWGGTAVLAGSLLDLPRLEGPRPVTLLLGAPTVVAELLGAGGLPASVRTIDLSGEAVPRSLPERLYRETAVERVFNFYGISETTTHTIGALLPRPDGDGNGRVPAAADAAAAGPVIGRPIAGVRVYLLDANMEPVPVGVAGELYVGGAGVGRGYLGRPGLTAQRFVPDPFGNRPGARLYRSGDLARWRPGGDIEYLGRGDRQVKLRGFRIELGEVESALRRCPGVGEAAAALHQDDQGRRQLVAYLVPAGTVAPAPAELRAVLRERLPEHAVPTSYVALESLPVTPNGKVDRAALAALEPRAGGDDDGLWRVADAIETQVELIWNDLLGTEGVDPRDSFFDAGGDSLLALVMLTRVEETFGVRVPVGGFMAAPTVEELSSAIRGHGWSMPGSCLVKVSGTGGGDGAGGPRPFFCVHPGGGELYQLRYLRRELGERPVYALMPIGWNGEAEPLASIEEMAARYIEEIRAVQPYGPYLLGGYSLAGMIALEIAQQLQALGERTSFLGLFETWPVLEGVVCLPEDAYEYESTVEAVNLAMETGRAAIPASELLYLKSLSAAVPALEALQRSLEDKRIYDFEGLCRELEDMRPKLREALDQLKARGLVVHEMDVGEFFRMHEVAAKQVWAKSRYRPRHYPGDAVLFAGPTVNASLLEQLWRPLVGGLGVERIAPEEHSEIFRDPSLARALRRRLEAAEGAGRVTPASPHEAVGSR